MKRGPRVPSVSDVVRWLQTSTASLLLHPAAALQLALDTPPSSFPHRRALAFLASHPEEEPPTQLLNKPQRWPAARLVLNPGSPVRAVRFVGSSIAVGTERFTIQFYDTATGQPETRLSEHRNVVYAVDAHPGQPLLLTGSQDLTARIWDLRTGLSTATLEGHTYYVKSVAFTADGTRCGSGYGTMV